ncbi:DUF1822 family protein [Leptothoe kymatousa]|uniref:DUF1822 family protein n=1 Tax=Leptothoe kymatousa TAU-MAC 1615 TaxID=2364775 RepID=A0ABS5Y2C6_9CYAN|nr:DUF1822 family protein [Leptothoe kymatousa]MBT9311952.1 DUF1822 family protein [Leptothoe kymatousa TAU-MAC 1615]
MSVFFDNPVQPILAMPIDVPQWQSHASIADAATRWRLYLHQLGLAAITTWLQEEFDSPVLPWPHAAPFDMWANVEGLCLELGDRRLIIILSEAIKLSEIEVPQEWVDMPQWQADYYLAAHVNVDEEQLILWGYTHHSTLKTKGTYTTSTRTYHLNAEEMIQDFSAFWVAQQMPRQPLPPLEPLPKICAPEATALMQTLVDSPEPRLAIPFPHWGALVSNEAWRKQLCQSRQQISPVNIRDWLNNIYTQGWGPLESLFPGVCPAEFRSVVTSNAVLTCGKKIAVGDYSDDLLLMFNIDMESDNRRNIRIQLYPSSEPVLPRNIVLSLELSETGQLLKTVHSGGRDSFIQIPPFRCQAGQQLRVTIQLEDASRQEEFIS